MLLSGLCSGYRRLQRRSGHDRARNRSYSRALRKPFRLSRKLRIILSLLVLITLGPLPSATRAALLSPNPATTNAPAALPLVTGVDLTLSSAAFSAGDGGSEAKDPYFNNDITLPAGKSQAVFTSDPVRAPIDFSDVAPHW